MSRKSVLAALVLISVGIVFGALLVGSLDGGVGIGLAGGGGDVKLGGPVPVTTVSQDVKGASASFVSVAKAVTPCVVSITVTTSGKEKGRTTPQDFFHFFGPDGRPPESEPSQGSGSGVVITPDGYIVTNNHVVEGADKDGIEVVLNDKSRYKARLVGTDPTTDLAVIRIDARDLTAAALGNSENVQVGEWVLAIGNPLGLTSTVTAGIVSAIGRNIRIINDSYGIENFIQTDAAINPGNSGGALVNMNGEVVGINTAIATTNARYQGYGFAVPVNLLKTVAADLIKDGKVRRGYIGVQIQSVDATMANALGLDRTTGVLVQSVVKGGAGEQAGLKERDVILSVDGKETNEANELQSHIATRHPGDVVVLKVFRDGKTIEKKVTLKPREEDANVRATREDEEKPPESNEMASTLSIEGLGLSVRALSTAERKEVDVDNGVLVVEVKPYSEAAERGIAPQDVIVEADRKEVNTPKELKGIVDRRKGGDSILMRVKRQGGATAYVAVQIPMD
jgi:serine protease Do